jgi:cytochrome c oxidase cbb3-type subunit 1
MSATVAQVEPRAVPDAPPDYDDHVVRLFIVAAVFWALVGMGMGVFIAAQMVWPDLNVEPWFTFGRLRPVHTSGVVFAFGGNAVIGTSLYCVQRTCRARLPGRFAAEFVFWGYQLFIILAALGYVMGVTQSREYAEPSG